MNTWNKSITRSSIVILLILFVFTGCASTSGDLDDPWENTNRSIQGFNDDFDETIMKPLAKGYIFTTPEPVSRGISNFFSNIDDLGVTINDLLQFKLLQAGNDMSRFFINTTVGIAGFMDIATELDLPKHNEDFDQTLAVWGVPSGPYLVLPFWGPSSPRGIAGLMGDALLDPLNYTVFFGFGANLASTVADVVNVTDTRAGFMTSEKIVSEAAIDRYDFLKGSYQQRRNYLIYDGNVPEGNDFLELDTEFEDPANYKLELLPPTEE